MHPVGEDRLEPGELLRRGLTQPLVASHGHRGAVGEGDLDGNDLAFETPFGGGGGGLVLADQAQVVDLGAGDASTLGDALGGTELVGHVPPERVGS